MALIRSLLSVRLLLFFGLLYLLGVAGEHYLDLSPVWAFVLAFPLGALYALRHPPEAAEETV